MLGGFVLPFSTSASLQLDLHRTILQSALTLGNVSKEKDVYSSPDSVALRHENPASWEDRPNRR